MMNSGIIILSVFKYSVVTLICIALIVLLIRNRGTWFKPEVIRDDKLRESAMRHLMWFRGICIGATVILFCAVLALVPPLMQDIPHIARGEYLTAEGTVVSDSLGGAAGRVQEREFNIIDVNTGEEIHLVALESGLRKGEYVKVTYLPNSHLVTVNYRE